MGKHISGILLNGIHVLETFVKYVVQLFSTSEGTKFKFLKSFVYLILRCYNYRCILYQVTNCAKQILLFFFEHSKFGEHCGGVFAWFDKQGNNLSAGYLLVLEIYSEKL